MFILLKKTCLPVAALALISAPALAETTIVKTTTQTPIGGTSIEKTTVIKTPGVPVTPVTTTSTSVTEAEHLPNVKRIDFMSFDVNHDAKLSMREVGDVLFKAFDGDGNGAIDNIEYDRASVLTVIPMKTTTLTFVDYGSDNSVEDAVLTRDEFLKRSNLMRFDKDEDGLSPRDFMGSEIKAMDLNHNNLIEYDEWKRGYALKVQPKVAIQKRYNR